MKDYITTYTKRHVTPLDPEPSELSVLDIAHALSLMVRANGHFPEFYSVGQHCIHCAREAQAEGLANRLVLACLLHDAGEAYLADITRPVKKHLPKYRETEQKLLDAVYLRFLGSALTAEEELEVKRVDDTLLYYEFLHYMGEALQEEPPKISSQPVFETRAFAEVEKEYLQLFEELTGKGI
ncbi:MAG: phosphohydrolase [Blautia sp.]|jgi:5'-deoxynucleotidase YfbR-like HD superfamily hydrolase